MGWTGIRNTLSNDSPKARRDLVDHEIETSWSGYHVVKSSMHNSTYYAAIEHPRGHVFGLVILTEVRGNEFLYKEMDETECPYFFDCPTSILKLLSPTENEEAIEWRVRCREHQNRMSAWKKIKSTPNVHIQVVAKNLSRHKDGDEIILHRALLYGRLQWYDGTYIYHENTVERLTNGYIYYSIVTPDGQNYCDLNYYK